MYYILRKTVLVIFLTVALFAISRTCAHAATVGVILTRNMAFYEEAHKAFLSHLEGKGFGKNLKFIIQRPHPDAIAWSNASRKLIAADVDVIVTYGSPATLSAIKERSNIPIIYAAIHESVASGIDAKNVTGICSKPPLSSLMRYIKASVEDKNIGVLYCGLEKDSLMQFEEIKELSLKYGLAITPIELKKPADISTLLSGLETNALLMTTSSMVSSVYSTALSIARGRNIPTASLIYQSNHAATIMLYPSPEEQGKDAASRLIKILKGVSAWNIPNKCSKDMEIVFNLKDARDLGIRIPMDLVTEATRIIY